MNCDRIAPIYKFIEYAAFGRRLERHRFSFPHVMENCEHALLLGDGDGRFLAELAGRNSSLRIDCVELSARMTSIARKRLANRNIRNPSRITFLQTDARTLSLPPPAYDLIVSNFFLDCFSTSELSSLIPLVAASCLPKARWVNSDFQQPGEGWKAWHAAVWLKVMYLFFGLATQLKANSLPLYKEALADAGFVLESKITSMADLICSEVWRLTRPPDTDRDLCRISHSSLIDRHLDPLGAGLGRKLAA